MGLLQYYLPETGETFDNVSIAQKREREIAKEIETYKLAGIWDLVDSDHPVWGRNGSAYLACWREGCFPGQAVIPPRRKRLERARRYQQHIDEMVRSKVS